MWVALNMDGRWQSQTLSGRVWDGGLSLAKAAGDQVPCSAIVARALARFLGAIRPNDSIEVGFHAAILSEKRAAERAAASALGKSTSRKKWGGQGSKREELGRMKAELQREERLKSIQARLTPQLSSNSGEHLAVRLPGGTLVVNFRGDAAAAAKQLKPQACDALAVRLRAVYPHGDIGNAEWNLFQWSKSSQAPWRPHWGARAPARLIQVPTLAGEILVVCIGVPFCDLAELDRRAQGLKEQVQPMIPPAAHLSARTVEVMAFDKAALSKLHHALDQLHLSGSQHSKLMLTWQELRDRKWSTNMIAEFLGEPDYIDHDSVNRIGPAVRLWRLAHILEAERAEAFQARRAALGKKRSVGETA